MATFIRANSSNLPRVDTMMLMEYMRTSDKYNVAEIRGAKALMSSRESYVENAVGYVEIKREGSFCEVRAKIVPEHRISNKYYVSTVQINETTNTIQDTLCDGCVAAAGGCKHTVVFLYWLQERSAEPSPTSVKCYWAKPSLASARYETVQCEQIFKASPFQLGPKDSTVLEKFRAEAIKQSCSKALILTYDNVNSERLSKYCVFDIMVDFVAEEEDHSYENFKIYSNRKIQQKKQCICQETVGQANSKLWHCMRQGRITGSKIHEVAHCKTADGHLVEELLGGYKVPETKAMKRGKMLEKKVIVKLEEELQEKFYDAGFYLINGIFGVSPDAIGNNFVIEIKCPISEHTKNNYINNNKLSAKCMGQIQLEMLGTGINQCLFCVADPNFEQNGNIEKKIVNFDRIYIETLMNQAEEFWKRNIYPTILQSAHTS